MKPGDVPSIAPLIGTHVRVRVVFDIRGYRQPSTTYQGRLIAIGKKAGPSVNTRPFCLVLDCGDKGVPIIALRSVVAITPVAPTGPGRHGRPR